MKNVEKKDIQFIPDINFLLDIWAPKIAKAFFDILYGVGINSLIDGTYKEKKEMSNLAQEKFLKKYFRMGKKKRQELLCRMGEALHPNFGEEDEEQRN